MYWQLCPIALGIASIDICFFLSREMTLHDSEPDFVGLAPDSLQSMSFKDDTGNAAERIQGIARLSALTRLELIEFDPHSFHSNKSHDHVPYPVELEPLLQLPLVELIIIASQNIEQLLLDPGTFSKSQRLHIEESVVGMRDNEPSEQRQQSLKRTGNAIFSLPDLQQVSGASSIFTAAQDHQLQHWQLLQTIEPPMTSYSMTEHASLSCWRRP